MDLSESRHISVAVNLDAAEAYARLWQPERFPEWASGLGALRWDGDSWVADGTEGEVAVRFSPQNDFGVLDHWVRLPCGHQVYLPFRVVANGHGCELVFTLFRQPEMDDARFASDADWVRRDLLAAKALLESG